MVVQWWAKDGDNRLYRYREIYVTGQLVEDVAKQAKTLSIGERIVAIICDHAAGDRATFERHFGKTTLPARKAIAPGIQKVQARLRPDKTQRPAIYLIEGALVEADPELVEAHLPTCTEEEFDGYIWAVGADGKPSREVPIDENNHGLDGLRYMVAYLDLKPLKSTGKARSHVQSNYR